jgi:hypothetical protein
MDKPEKLQISSSYAGLHFSRREFLKLTGISFSSVIVSNAQILSINNYFYQPLPPASPTDIEAALTIAKESVMFNEVVGELYSIEFEFNIAKDAVVNSSNNDPLIGLVLHHSQSTSHRFGVDLILTVDIKNSLLNRIQTIVGWSLLDTIEIASSEFDLRLPLYPEYREERVSYDTPPNMIRPRIEHQWSFWRPDSPPITPDDLVQYGWPIEKSDSHYWYFDGCSNASWVNEGGMWVYRCEQVAEHQSDDPKNQRELELKYLEQDYEALISCGC